MNERMQEFYMRIAYDCAAMSRAERTQVGAVIVKNDNIISHSWNGTPTGWNNTCESKEYMGDVGFMDPDDILSQWPLVDDDGRYKLVTIPEVLHAETNAISKLAKGHESGHNASIFSTMAPCIHCAKLIYQSGITSFYYHESYRITDGLDFLKAAKVKVIQI